MPTEVKAPRAVFPASDAVPEPARFERSEEGPRYLMNGQVLQWAGPQQEVLAPVCLRGTDGLVQAALGGYPLMTEAESLLALEAACGAFGKGCGEWPTIADRIRCVEAFIPRMQAARERVVRLLMWESRPTDTALPTVAPAEYAAEASADRFTVHYEDVLRRIQDHSASLSTCGLRITSRARNRTRPGRATFPVR